LKEKKTHQNTPEIVNKITTERIKIDITFRAIKDELVTAVLN